MPNHIKNRLELIGENIDILLDGIKGEYDDGSPMYIDFKKIVPQPEELILNPSLQISGAANAVMSVKLSDNELIAALESENRKRDLESISSFDDGQWKDFIQCLQNIRSYGHATWYTWNVKNWGTKWNAYSQELHNNIIMFETAWSNVVELILKLSEKHKDITFNYSYADEDTGYNAGEYIIKDGEIKHCYQPEGGSKEAYDLAFKLRPENKEYYKLINGQYEYVEE